MITYRQIIPPTSEKENYATISARIQATYTGVEDLGICTDGVKHVYGVPFGDTSKPCIFINAGIHGDEWESAYWVLHFLDCLIDPETVPPTVSGYFEMLRSKYSFYFIPILNPYGYEENIRYTVGSVDLNRNYDVDTYVENVMIKTKVLLLKPVLFIDNHTSMPEYESSGVGGNSGIDYEIFGQHLINSVKYLRRHNSVDWYSTNPVLIDMSIGRGWASNQVSSTGKKTLSILFEGARSGSLGNFSDKVTFGFNGILMACILADRYFSKGIMAA